MPAGVRFNRALWVFRATFALVALGLLAMIVRPDAFRAEPASPPVPTVVRGHTAQGVPISMSFDRPGHPIAFDTRIRGRCFNGGRRGRVWDWGWRGVDGRSEPFRRAGSTLRVAFVDDRRFDDPVFGQVVLAMHATVAPGRKQARGWVRMVATFYYAVGPTTCDSGRVAFAVGATSARPS
jgi:hypothetical protein